MTTRKKAAEVLTQVNSATCANCGEPATVKEVGNGFVPDVYCDACGERAYPGGTTSGGPLESL
jgi:hypothetical protein